MSGIPSPRAPDGTCNFSQMFYKFLWLVRNQSVNASAQSHPGKTIEVLDYLRSVVVTHVIADLL